VEITNMMQRMRELSVQSANDTNAKEDRNYLDLEFQQLKQEINRITKNTQWNGMNILDQTEPASSAREGTFTFQVGANQGDAHKITHKLDKLSFGSSAGLMAVADTTTTGVQTSDVTFSGDFKSGDVITLTVNNKQLQYTVTDQDDTPAKVAAGVAKTLGASQAAAQVDTISLKGSFAAGDKVDLTFNSTAISYTVLAGDVSAGNDAATLAAVRTGVIAAINTASTTTATAAAGTEAGDITLTAATAGTAFTTASTDIQVELSTTTANAVTQNGSFDGLTVKVDGSKLSFVGEEDQTFDAFAVASDGKLGSVAELKITTQSFSDSAIAELDKALTTVNEARAEIGAVINRLNYAVDNMTNVSMNTSESRSRILDTDYAKASAELARTQIISQAATAMLAQANQQPQAVLQLLQG